MACIEAHRLRKTFRTTVALDGIDSRVEEHRILGLMLVVAALFIAAAVRLRRNKEPI